MVQRNQIDYAVACVSEFAKAKSLSLQDAFLYLYNYKSMDFLQENYEAEHTLSFYDVVNDLSLVAQKNGGTL